MREIFHSWSKRGTKARGMRDSRRATNVFNFPSSAGSAIRAMMILHTEGTVPENFGLLEDGPKSSKKFGPLEDGPKFSQKFKNFGLYRRLSKI